MKALHLENQNVISEDLMIRAMEVLLKEFQLFPDEIRKKIDELYPPPPPKEKNTELDELEVMTGRKKRKLNPRTNISPFLELQKRVVRRIEFSAETSTACFLQG